MPIPEQTEKHFKNFSNQKSNIAPSMTDGYDDYQIALAELINGILKEEFLIYKCNKWGRIKNSSLKNP